MKDFEIDDEVVWHDDSGQRHRGRVCADGDELIVRPYDVLGRLQTDEQASVSPLRLKITSGIDQLAEVAPFIVHLSHAIECYGGGRGAPKATHCGDWQLDTDARPWKLHTPSPEVDQALVHQLALYSDKLWSKLISSTALALDFSDRSEPLDDRELSDEAYEQADELKLCRRCFRAAVMASTWPLEPGKLSEHELTEFVLGFIDGSVYSDRHIPSYEATVTADSEEEAQRAGERWGRDCSMVFMCLLLGSPPPPDYAKKVGCVWEWFKDAGPRSCNGMPGFFSHHFMHIDDWRRAAPAIDRELERRRNFSL